MRVPTRGKDVLSWNTCLCNFSSAGSTCKRWECVFLSCSLISQPCTGRKDDSDLKKSHLNQVQTAAEGLGNIYCLFWTFCPSEPPSSLCSTLHPPPFLLGLLPELLCDFVCWPYASDDGSYCNVQEELSFHHEALHLIWNSTQREYSWDIDLIELRSGIFWLHFVQWEEEEKQNVWRNFWWTCDIINSSRAIPGEHERSERLKEFQHSPQNVSFKDPLFLFVPLCSLNDGPSLNNPSVEISLIPTVCVSRLSLWLLPGLNPSPLCLETM